MNTNITKEKAKEFRTVYTYMKKNAIKLASEFRKFLLCIHLIKEFGILIPCPALYDKSESKADESSKIP